jgi:hypothetical protein
MSPVQPLSDRERQAKIDARHGDPAVGALVEQFAREHWPKVAAIMAAFQIAEAKIDSVAYAAHQRGMPYREIGERVGLRTADVRERCEALAAHLAGNPPPVPNWVKRRAVDGT